MNKYILMYHSIESKKHPAVMGSFPITMDRFIYQVNNLKNHGYKFDFVSNLHKDIAQNDKVIYITGDDGTVDWTKNILPWCEENQIPTHTGVITGPFESKPIYPLTHLIQIILITRSQEELIRLSNKLEKEYLSVNELNYINNLYHYEKLEYRRIIKGSFNLILNKNDSYELIGLLSKEEEELLQSRFEKLEYYKQFKYAEVGVHTRSHWALGKNINKYIKDEIISCRDLLIKNGLEPTKYYTSPMKPKYGSKTEDLISPLKKYGFKGIFDQDGIWNSESYIIRRIDAKDVETFFNLKGNNR